MTLRTYVRISRRDEAAILENQRRTVREYAGRLGPHVEYEDTASGGSEDRPGWNRLLADVRAGDLAIFTSLSRMTRGGVGAAWDTLRRLEAAGAGWHFTEQSILNYDAGTPKLVRDVILAILAAVDEDYRRRISQATRAALARRKALTGHGTPGRARGARDKGPRKKRLPPRTTDGREPRIDGPSIIEGASE